METVVTNPYLTGNFAPVHDERDDAGLDVTGAIPPELDGLLLRNGPNPIVAPEPPAYHWFVGDGMLHGIELSRGRARYRNRWVRTDGACEALGETSVAGQPDDVFPGGSSVANTDVVAHRGRIFALVEITLPTEVRADLSTVGRTDFDGALRSPMTAHPKLDPRTGELVFFGYDIMGPPWLRYHVLDAFGALVTTQEITIGGPAMIHDFAITSSRVVWLDLPVVYDLSTFGQQPFPAAWDPGYRARVGVMPRLGSDEDVVWTDIDPCYVFHTVNAYDDADGNVVVDVVRYADMFAVERFGPGSMGGTTLDRWTIDPGARTLHTERLDDESQEFPRIDERVAGQPHRYGYTVEQPIAEHWHDSGGLRKHDFVSGRVERHDVGPGRHAGEPVFAPASPDAGEDHGWVLSVVYDETTDTSDVIVVDATDFSAAPVATVHLRRRVPYGFHGMWLRGASLD
ncbi:MAG TPA: carotenoid oxygenase family protein [Acidimicrobiia bacterium]